MPLAEQATKRRTNDEADPDSHAHQAEVLGALFRRTHIGNQRVSGGIGGAGHARENSPHKEQRERGGKSHQQVVDRIEAEGQQQHWTAPEGITGRTQHRRKKELQYGIADHQVTAPDGRIR